MPMWCPPTPPQQDGDMYVDHTMSFLYGSSIMIENQLPAVYIKKESKRTRVEAGLADSRRPVKVPKRDDITQPPKSLFDRSPLHLKMRRDARLQKYRSGLIRPQVPIPGVKYPTGKPHIEQPGHNWTIHEDAAILKVIQSYQGLNLNLFITSAGHTPNWDFVADYVNTVSIAYRSPKQCRNRYETVLIPREEGKQIIDTSPRKKKQKGMLCKFPVPTKSNRPMRTSQLYIQDNNSSFAGLMTQRYDALKAITAKRPPLIKSAPIITSVPLKNPKHESILSEAGIDLDHPVSAIDIAAKRAERIAREKKVTPEQLQLQQKLHLFRQVQAAQAAAAQSSNAQSAAATTSQQATQQTVTQTVQVSSVQTTTISTVTSTVLTTPNTPTNALRMQRIVAASPLQNQSVVSVSGISPAQLQAATQRLIVSSGAPGQSKATVVGTGAMAGKTISPAQLQMIRQAQLKQQQMRLQQGGLTSQALKTTTVVTIPGQNAVQVQFTQAQPRTHIIKGGTVAVANKQVTRAMTESEVHQFLKMKNQKIAAAQATTIANQQVFAQALQAGPSGTQVATIVKAVSSSGVTQTVIGTPVKALPQGMKTQTTPQHIRTLQIQQHMLQKKNLLNQQKIAGIAQVTGKGAVATQLIVGSKPLTTAMTMQQFQQVIRSPMTVPQGPVVLATKGTSRMVPVNAGQGNKPTIQVVAAPSQGLTTTIRPPTSTTLTAAALAGLKVQNAAGSSHAQQQAILSQVSAALGQNVRQGSPVRLQTASGTPVVAVTVQSSSPSVQQVQQQQADKGEHAS